MKAYIVITSNGGKIYEIVPTVWDDVRIAFQRAKNRGKEMVEFQVVADHFEGVQTTTTKTDAKT